VKKDIKTLKFNKKILIVEDNKINMKVAKKLLSKIGYENVDSAENGEVGYKKYKKNNGYDLILMDCQMPVMDGFESTKLIREYEKENKMNACPIIALTANSSEDDKNQCFEAGMNYFMSKPIKRETVSETLTSIFENKIQKTHYL
jgi:CheY-like chemotaxis protein